MNKEDFENIYNQGFKNGYDLCVRRLEEIEQVYSTSFKHGIEVAIHFLKNKEEEKC